MGFEVVKLVRGEVFYLLHVVVMRHARDGLWTFGHARSMQSSQRHVKRLSA